MRKITPLTLHHNRAVAWLLAGLSLALLTACGGDERPPAQKAAGHVHRTAGCAVVIDDQALADFYALADRVAAGEEVSLEEMSSAVSDPVWDRWRRSFAPEHVTAVKVGGALFIALRGREALPDHLRGKATSTDLVGNYRVNIEQRERIESFTRSFTADDVACGTFEILAEWLEPAAMPDTLRIDLLVGHPEIRLYEDHVMLDAGLAWAAGRDQLTRFLASTVYRGVNTIDGRDPDQANGPAILLETLRLVRNEAIPSYLDDFIEITFDPRHRLLKGASPVPDQICLQAQRTIISLDAALDHVLSLPNTGNEDWLQVYRLFVGARSVQPTGWYMAQVIEERFGRDRLIAANRTVADFFAAYQEAALLSPAAPTAEAGSVAWFLESAPPFGADRATWIVDQLRLQFP